MCSFSAQAQWQRRVTPGDTLKSVRVLPNGNTILSIYAPKARTVSITGDIQAFGVKPVEKNGVWSFEIPNVKPGAYRYHFVVDGVQVYDPKSQTTVDNTALAVVEPNGPEFFSYNPNIPHGAMAIRKYQSKTTGTTRTMRVWTPAGYEKSKAKLPVLYLVHGGGDTDASWPGPGCAGDILDNLLAEGKMVPMIVVMPNGAIDISMFEKDLMNDVIPFVESNYRVLADKDHRAISGLSMGGIETLEVIFQNPDKFGYVWCLSGGFNPGVAVEKEAERLNVKAHAAIINKNCKEFVMTQGGKTDITYISGERANKLFDEVGLKYEYMEVGEGHTWYTWKLNLYDEAQRLFKK
ncbi:MAG: endo-1,4-beta-xylanase Z [Bacteroidales bacterium]|nr:endo-1,4-beta-xylanase Z [Bacteroidales bacterium]